MDLEEAVKTHKQLSEQIDALEKQRKDLGQMIMQQMGDKIIHVSHYIVRHCSRLSIKLSLEDARLLDMVKTQEVVDKERIKSLYEEGHHVPGVSETHYIQISEQKLKL